MAVDKTNMDNYGVLIKLNHKIFPYFTIQLFKALIVGKEVKGKLILIDSMNGRGYNLSEADQKLVKLLFQLNEQYLLNKAAFNTLWQKYYEDNSREDYGKRLSPEQRNRLAALIIKTLDTIFKTIGKGYPVFSTDITNEYLPKKWEVVTDFIISEARFKIQMGNHKISLTSSFNIDSNLQKELLGRDNFHNPFFTVINKQLVVLSNTAAYELIRKINDKGITLNYEHAGDIIDKYYLPYFNTLNFDTGDTIKFTQTDIEPKFQVLVKELGDFLILQPQALYDTKVVNLMIWKEQEYYIANDSINYFNRNKDKEQEFLNSIIATGPKQVNIHLSYYYVKKNDILKENWYFKFFEAMRAANVEILGLDSLKTMKLNANQAKINWNISSGIDWFEVDAEVTFGDQRVRLSELKKLAGKKEDVHVQLSDGSFGFIPANWIEEINYMVKLGKEEKGKVRLSKLQFSVIDEISPFISDQAILEEIAERKKSLMRITEIEDIPLPKKINASLRPYQKEGFQWMQRLAKTGWGGILADDMGLGKTLQALTFIVHLQEQKPDFKALIVCPTSLLFNWEAEINKFTTDLTYRVQYGQARSREVSEIVDSNILLISYGILRSDIDLLKNTAFDVAILDESHAIKNPSSQIAHVVKYINAKLRLCLSGTPLQNNTFDLYAQMNFINPGLLGSSDFFRNEFANPIDKLGDPKQKEKLRRMVYPFMMRRTKEQVAKDLPDKTEMIFYCEMGEDQRTIYEAYRNEMRSKIEEEIDEEGLANSQMSVLTALTKLRQICDCPSLLSDAQFPSSSVKIKELLRELEENLGDHKALVFSQFVGMLSLVEEELKSQGIPYCYLDGSTKAEKRQSEVERFQSDEQIRVFLISLKAGGVGLNLTAADYVFLLDPWWNPAAENQAIDRTHRIGQTRNVLAYKFICKNTVEEKILKLQAIKKSLSEDITGSESGFIKKLSQEDIMYLFSE